MPFSLNRDVPSEAFVYFPGTAPPPDGAFGRLTSDGINVAPLKTDGALWVLRLGHPEWGTAELACLTERPPADEFTQFAINLTDAEKRAVAGSTSVVALQVPATRKDVLHDRKTMLRFASAVMGDDGLLAVDLASRLPWSRDSLADELVHDADLDIEALYCIHAVSHGPEDGEPRTFDWLHTHGLGEIGWFDFDVVRPSPEFVNNCGEPFRAIAFSILGGRLAESSDRVVIGNTLEVRTVPAPEFMRLASNADRAVRDIDEGHLDRRGVLCEPAGRRLFGFGGDRPVPLRLAQAGTLPEGSVLFFPDMATDLMAIRAKGTIDLLLSLVEEFAELEVQPLVKLGYPTDDGRSHEHLWFEFHGLTDSTIDATLQNEPYEVSSLRPRERALHPRDLLTDWILLSPVGSITPRSLAPARRMREDRDRLRDELAAWRREQEGGG